MIATGPLVVATLIAVLICGIAWVQRRQAQNPPRNAAAAQRRQNWAAQHAWRHLGVYVAADGFVYTPTGQPVGTAEGARAVILPARPVTSVRPSTAWTVIYFADGTFRRHMIPVADRDLAKAQCDRFNERYQSCGVAGIFKRTRPAPAALTSTLGVTTTTTQEDMWHSTSTSRSTS